MAVRIITTAVIDCDEPGCDACFHDCVALTPEEAKRLAESFGWFDVAGNWMCPICAFKLEKAVIEWAKQAK